MVPLLGAMSGEASYPGIVNNTHIAPAHVPSDDLKQIDFESQMQVARELGHHQNTSTLSFAASGTAADQSYDVGVGFGAGAHFYVGTRPEPVANTRFPAVFRIPGDGMGWNAS